MSSVQELVTDAFRLLTALDLNETAPSPTEMTVGIRALNSMIDAWAAQGLNVTDLTLDGDFTDGETTVTLESTARLAPGMNVSATGLSGRILSIDNSTEITMDTAASADGTSASIAFTVLPLQPRFEEGVAALLAMRLAPRIGEAEIPPMVQQLARDGWNAINANFMVVPTATIDSGLIFMSQARR